MGGTDLASRLRAKFSKRRRHSTTPSLASNPSGCGTDTWSLKSQPRGGGDREKEHSSLRAVSSQTRLKAKAETSSTTSKEEARFSKSQGDEEDEEDGVLVTGDLEPSEGKGDSQSQHHEDEGLKDGLSIPGKGDEDEAAPAARERELELDPSSSPTSNWRAPAPAPAPAPAAPASARDTAAAAPAAAPADSGFHLGPWRTSTTETPAPPGAAPAGAAPEQQLQRLALAVSGSDLQPARMSSISSISPSPSPTQLAHPQPPLSSNLDSINEDSSADLTPSPAAHSQPDLAAVHGPDSLTHTHTLSSDSHHAASSSPSTPATTFAPHLPTTTAPKTSTTAVSVAFAPTLATPTPAPHSSSSSSSPARPPAPPRRQSLLSNRQTTLIKTLLHSPVPNDYGGEATVLPIDAEMVTRKVWVKRSNASPTLITINEDDLVDDVRDMILRKYANSLGRTFDSPDLNIRLVPRDQHKDRILGPEEPMGRTLDAYYPGGQTVDEALIIEPPRRAPKASPRPPVHAYQNPNHYYPGEDGRPSETGEGYFPPVGGVPSPHLPVAVPAPTNVAGPHSIAVLGTGHIPPIPSPGGTRSRAYRERPERPRLGRTHTSSPTIIANNPPGSIAAAANHDPPNGMPPTQQAVPTPPAPETSQNRVATPPPRLSSPRPPTNRPKRIKKSTEVPNLPPGMLMGGVPPISVLIVEDNPINLKLLEAFVKRLKVRWKTATNGQEAVNKWRAGGFHLVLMDIQLPIMNGLDATREIRRLERVNSIGVFSSSPGGSTLPEESAGELQDQDRLENPSLFKSPVIIVALTASSLQSDRHQALAAGCNDFLTKPVNFVWLERKVMEWGCMQALIDYDGWRKWKDFSHEADDGEANKKAEASKKTAAGKAKSKKHRTSMSSTVAA